MHTEGLLLVDDSKKVLNRLKRSEGQLKAVIRMIENQEACSDVLTQLSAVRSGIDRAMGIIAVNNLLHCVDENDQNAVDSAVSLLLKAR